MGELRQEIRNILKEGFLSPKSQIEYQEELIGNYHRAVFSIHDIIRLAELDDEPAEKMISLIKLELRRYFNTLSKIPTPLEREK